MSGSISTITLPALPHTFGDCSKYQYDEAAFSDVALRMLTEEPPPTTSLPHVASSLIHKSLDVPDGHSICLG